MRSPRRSTRPSSAPRHWLWLAVAPLAVVVLIPFVLCVIYRVVDPISTPMLWRRLAGERVERAWVPLAGMAQALPPSVVAAEDAAFCSHHGVDFAQLREAIDEADDLTEARGGSTITQQTAKNLFLWPSRSFVRKALELPLALWLDLVLPKSRILEIYLNIAEWGPDGEFGAEAGAHYAFGKSVRAVTPREAALLAAVLPNPVARSARRPGPGMQRLAGIYQVRAAAVATGCMRTRRG